MTFNREIQIVKVQSGSVLTLYTMVGYVGVQKNHVLYTSNGQRSWNFGQFVNSNYYAIYSIEVGEWDSQASRF